MSSLSAASVASASSGTVLVASSLAHNFVPLLFSSFVSENSASPGRSSSLTTRYCGFGSVKVTHGPWMLGVLIFALCGVMAYFFVTLLLALQTLIEADSPDGIEKREKWYAETGLSAPLMRTVY